MKKAVVIVDIPDYIYDISKIELAYGLYFRKRSDEEPVDPTDILEYHEVYPLIPLPTKREIPFGTPFCKGEAKGWNDCLKEITGEKE